jgi:hypothetical protein
MELLHFCLFFRTTIWDGIIIGGAGGAIAGIVVWGIQAFKEFTIKEIHKKRVYNWLKKNIPDKNNNQFRSTRTIASFNNLTEDRVKYICSIHKKIHLSVGIHEDRWTLTNNIENSN